MKYQFYAIIFDVAGNTTPVGSSTSPAKSFVTNIQKVTGISINPSGSITKNIGENFTISATITPSDANNKTINWDSSNKTVATVDSNGKVSCLAAGSTTITATSSDGSGISASLALTVRNPINSMTLNKNQTTLQKSGSSTTVTATTDPTDYTAIEWSIGDNSIATISSNGKTCTITPTAKTGTTTLTAIAGTITITVTVNVVNFTGATYSYTGNIQNVTLPAGTYKLECWGAQGGNNGGKGAKVEGIFTFLSQTTLYVCVGGNGSNHTGYNGGGNGDTSYKTYGGGATHIGLKNSVLTGYSSDYSTQLLIVAGGGGATAIASGGNSTTSLSSVNTAGIGGDAGQNGVAGGNAILDSRYGNGGGGATTSGGGMAGTAYSFGYGAGAGNSFLKTGAGGGGLFGGGSGGRNNEWN